MKTESNKPLLSEADKEAIFKEMCEKKRIKSWIVILVALLVGLLLAFLLGFVLPMIIQQQRQQSADRALFQEAGKMIAEMQENTKKATSITIKNPFYKGDQNSDRPYDQNNTTIPNQLYKDNNDSSK